MQWASVLSFTSVFYVVVKIWNKYLMCITFKNTNNLKLKYKLLKGRITYWIHVFAFQMILKKSTYLHILWKYKLSTNLMTFKWHQSDHVRLQSTEPSF